jgi:hypothetical protein
VIDCRFPCTQQFVAGHHLFDGAHVVRADIKVSGQPLNAGKSMTVVVRIVRDSQQGSRLFPDCWDSEDGGHS